MIGGGYIGLEVAASLATYGTAATLPHVPPQLEPFLVTDTTQRIPHKAPTSSRKKQECCGRSLRPEAARGADGGAHAEPAVDPRDCRALREAVRVQGRPLQLDTIQLTLKAPGTKRLQLYDELLPSFAVNLNLRRCTQGTTFHRSTKVNKIVEKDGKVGRCRLTRRNAPSKRLYHSAGN